MLLDQISNEAARGGHLQVLQWLHQQDIAQSWRTCREAAAGGHLNVLQWAWGQGYPWGEDTL